MPVMTPNPAVGINCKLAIGTTSTVDKPLDFESETLGLRESFLDPQGLRGTRSHASNRVRPNSRLVTGDIVLPAPTFVEMSYVLPYIMGGTPSGTSYPLGETLAAFYTQILRGGSRFTYSGCRMSRAVFSARKGTALQLTLSVLGIDETKDATAFPSLTLDATTNYAEFEEGVFTINGDTIDCFDFSMTVDNFVQARMVNSQIATVVYSTDRVVSWRFTLPWGDDEALYNLGTPGVSVAAVFTSGATSLSLTSPKVAFPRQSPDVAGRDELRNILEGMARYSSVPNDELAATLDSVP